MPSSKVPLAISQLLAMERRREDLWFEFMTEHVIVTDADGIRTFRMDRPDKKNALSVAMYEAMTVALETANAADASAAC